MPDNQLPDEIRKVAMDLDNALESKDIEQIVSCFADDCEIELLGIKLTGKGGVRKWLDWLYEHLDEVKLVPVIIMVDGDTFFEEFLLKAKIHNGIQVQSRQAEVLIYEDYQIKSLRLYFDRLDFADVIAKDFISKMIVRQLIKTSLKRLT